MNGLYNIDEDLNVISGIQTEGLGRYYSAQEYPLIYHALVNTIIDIGQLTNEQIRILNNAVKRGQLSKGKGGPFPKMKTVYAKPGFDFIADRKKQVSEILSSEHFYRSAIESKKRHG